MNRIILQPAGNKDAKKHYVDTIKNPIPLPTIKPYVTEEIYYKLKNIFREGCVPVWGVTPGKKDVNKNKWLKVTSGDIVLFSRNNKIFSSATVAFTIHNKELSLKLWKTNKEGETWEYMYFLDEVVQQHIPYKIFNKAASYEINNTIQGFSVLEKEKSLQIMNLLDLQSETYYSEISKEEYYKSISEPNPEKPLDKIGQAKGRTEQAFLRNELFKGKKVSNCGFCRKEYPISFLIAAHIKKRANCNEVEKRDYKNIIMPLCRFGCDELYEKGYVAVDNGIIIDTKTKYKTDAILDYLNLIVDKHCSYWTKNTKAYFEWHKKLNTKS